MRCDLFCAVIDNHGDLGVCWRLARQLAGEHGVGVTLWVDDLAAFAAMAPTLDPARMEQTLGSLTVRHWTDDVSSREPGELVIEGFGCNLPEGFLRAMARQPQAPLWINLEYLSAEAWVEDCHAMTSIHPGSGMVRHFWFPGFSPRTGGLLRETGLIESRTAFQADAEAQAAFWARLGLPGAMAWQRRISLFAYENPAIPALFNTLADMTVSTLMLVPAGRALTEVSRWAGRDDLAPGADLQRGSLTVRVLPFLAHADYDRLLQACDLNLVRGEDSFVRAQWAARPLLWHIYPQEEEAHLVKLEAFIRQVEDATTLPPAWAGAMRAWNGTGAGDWPALLATLPAITTGMRDWCAQLTAEEDLARGLMRFYADRVESPPVKSHPGINTR